MASSNREASISKTLTYEGGYTNDPRDPGGATNFGITIADARLYWKHDAAPSDVKAMPKSVAINIYRQKYWAVLGCDDRPAGPDFVDFDFGVNSGVKRALAFRSALDAQNLSPINYVKAQTGKRLSFLQCLRTFSVFGSGWSNRVADVQATGVRMAVEAAGKPVGPSMRKRADAASSKSNKHTTAATATAGSSPILAHLGNLDTATTVGLCALGAVVAVAIIYFIWHAVHNAHLAAAYKDQIPCRPISPTSGHELKSDGTLSPSSSSPLPPASSIGLASSTSSPSLCTSCRSILPTSS
jgi:lysozyme family protein